VTAEVAALDDLLVREEMRQRPHCGRLAGALLAPDQDAPDRGVNRVEHQRQLHVVLADDGGEGIGVAVYGHGI